MTTAAESPWSNGLVERHNATLGESLHKVMADNPGCNVKTALAWSVSAKNSLTNVHGFSPAQLALGYNPQFPSVISDSPPALEKPSEEIVASHLNLMKSAREAYIKAESSERIKRALKNKNTMCTLGCDRLF